jgi:hypothetical protein
VYGHVDIVINDRIGGGTVLVDFNLIQTEIDGSGDGTIELIEITSHRHGEGGRSAKSRGGRTAHVQYQIRVGDAGRNVRGRDFGEFRIAAVDASLQVGRGDEEIALNGYHREGGGPKVRHAGEDNVFDKVYFLGVVAGSFSVEGGGVKVDSDGFEWVFGGFGGGGCFFLEIAVLFCGKKNEE